MKKFKLIFSFLLLVLFYSIGFTQEKVNKKNDYVGHVTLIKKTAITVGGGITTPNSETKKLGFGNIMNFNLGLDVPITNIFGFHAFGEYNFGNGSFNSFQALPISGYTSTLTSTKPKFSGFAVGAGPQLNFGLGESIMFSPMVDLAFVNQKLEGYSINQNYDFGGATKSFSLYSQPEIKTSGLGIIPRLRFQYFFTKNIGIWLEGNYAMLPEIKTTNSTFVPNGTIGQGNEYNIDQILTGTTKTEEIKVKNSGIGFGGGIVINIGKQCITCPDTSKPKPTTPPVAVPTGGTTPKPKKIEIDDNGTPISVGEIFTSTPIKKENTEKQSCVKILSPSNGSNQNINENIKILLTNESLKNQKTEVKIYKVSNDKSYWNKAENRKSLLDTQNTIFLSGNLEKESIETGFKPISVDAKQSGAVLESNIDKGKLTEGAYKMVVVSNCGITTSNFMVSSSALTTVSLTTNCKEKFGDYSYTFVVKNTGTAPINVTSIPAFTSSTGTISGFSLNPSLPAVIPAGGTQNFTGSFTYTGTYTGDVYATVSGHQVGNVNLTSQDTEQGELKSCICDFCDKVLEFDYNQSPNATYSATSNSLSIHQDWWNMNTSAVTVVGAKAEIISFEREVSEDCMKCDKDSNQWGNFISGSSGTTNGSFGNATGSVTGNTHHTLYFANPNSYSFDLNINIPPISTLKCCCEKIRFKVRYTYIFKDKNGECKMCSAVFEYFYQRGDCPKKNPGNPIDINTGNINYVK